MSSAQKKSIGIFGEVLFDHLPDGHRVLGGAPFNVAWHLAAFGLAPHFISRVGSDAQGEEVRHTMQHWGMTLAGLQVDHTLPTGRVNIRLDDSGDPSYDIVDHCAYDAIAAVPTAHYSLLYHGTLAARHTVSAAALQQLRNAGHDTVFVDVNLRAPHWTRDSVMNLVRGADWIKLNAQELHLLAPGRSDTRVKARQMLEELGLRGLLVTSGSDGAELLLHEEKSIKVAPRQSGTVVDTVGAGDAFSSVMVMGLLLRWPLQSTMERCQEFAGSIVQRNGATVADRDFYAGFIAAWDLHPQIGTN